MVDFQSIRCCLHLFLVITSYIIFSSFIAAASDRITRGQSLRDEDTIISSEERFELGFFSPQDSNLRYVGIWHYQLTTDRSVVWVANRDNPISGNGGVLTFGEDGNLILFNDRQENISLWSSNVTVPSSSSSNSTLVLRDTGNLVLYGNNYTNPSNILWQSFDHPTDTYLPEMRVYLNVEGGGEEHVFTSWRNASDPSPGNFSMGVDSRGSPQIVIWAGPNRHWRSGHWNGLTFTGVPNVRVGYLYGFRLLNEDDGRSYFTYTTNSSNIVKFMIGSQGAERQELWNETSGEWNLIQSFPTSECERYNFCGAFATCDESADARKCSCIEGFVSDDDNGGCVRRTQLGCDVEEENRNNDGVRTDGFVRVEGVKLPDFVDYVGPRDENECRNMCLDDCSCNAYAFVSGINNCMMWSGELVDIQQFEEGGNDLFVRVSSSDLPGETTNRMTRVIIIIVITVFVAILSGVSVSIWLIRRHKANKYHDFSDTASDNAKPCPSEGLCAEFSQSSDLGGLERHHHEMSSEQVTMFSLAHVVTATDNFSEANLLGQGGFGPVYKGTLPGGEKIAVKRLSRRSGQGLEEFKNETTLIAKLQHRNLVRLLGCCIQSEEKMLLYEYMPNKSLDFYLFDRERRAQLDWIKRFNIIKGIARGLLYLHRDSRLRIIHRDLKPSNILLDEEMNPKISDFGMARMFCGNQNEANTNRVMGTYGYMAPEYAMEGLFSVKSDVYSFGVLLLEIISGQRNTTFRQTDDSSIISYAWDLWSSSRAIEFLDPLISSTCKDIEVEQVLTCMHVGMLCVQDVVSDRPNMSAIMLMLEIDADQITSTLPMPTKPTFTSIRHNDIEKRDFVSSNDVTISVILGR